MNTNTMMTRVDLEIVRRTPVHDGSVVITARKRDPNAIRRFRTFVVLPSSRYAQNLFDAVSMGAALHEHARLVHLIGNKRMMTRFFD